MEKVQSMVCSQTHQKMQREGKMLIMELGLIAVSLKLKSDKSLEM